MKEICYENEALTTCIFLLPKFIPGNQTYTYLQTDVDATKQTTNLWFIIANMSTIT